jgi:hypothetical protein
MREYKGKRTSAKRTGGKMGLFIASGIVHPKSFLFSFLVVRVLPFFLFRILAIIQRGTKYIIYIFLFPLFLFRQDEKTFCVACVEHMCNDVLSVFLCVTVLGGFFSFRVVRLAIREGRSLLRLVRVRYTICMGKVLSL